MRKIRNDYAFVIGYVSCVVNLEVCHLSCFPALGYRLVGHHRVVFAVEAAVVVKFYRHDPVTRTRFLVVKTFADLCKFCSFVLAVVVLLHFFVKLVDHPVDIDVLRAVIGVFFSSVGNAVRLSELSEDVCPRLRKRIGRRIARVSITRTDDRRYRKCNHERSRSGRGDNCRDLVEFFRRNTAPSTYKIVRNNNSDDKNQRTRRPDKHAETHTRTRVRIPVRSRRTRYARDDERRNDQCAIDDQKEKRSAIVAVIHTPYIIVNAVNQRADRYRKQYRARGGDPAVHTHGKRVFVTASAQVQPAVEHYGRYKREKYQKGKKQASDNQQFDVYAARRRARRRARSASARTRSGCRCNGRSRNPRGCARTYRSPNGR